MPEKLLLGIKAISEFLNASVASTRRRLPEMREAGVVMKRTIKIKGKRPQRMWCGFPSRIHTYLALKASKGEDF